MSNKQIMCPLKDRCTPRQSIWIKRGAIKGGNGGGQGPTGYKLRPARVLARSLADMASSHKASRR